jgi:hypothetical protein
MLVSLDMEIGQAADSALWAVKRGGFHQESSAPYWNVGSLNRTTTGLGFMDDVTSLVLRRICDTTITRAQSLL